MTSQAAQHSRDAFLDTLRELVEHETPTHDLERCRRLSEHLEGVLGDLGFDVERIDPRTTGPHLVARRDGPSASPSTLVLMHYDTVWPVGTLAERPFVLDGDRVSGPGTLDMKGGIAIFLQAVTAVRNGNLQLRGPVTALLTSDEEIGSLTSHALIEKLAKQHDRAIVLEPGSGAFDARIARKGVGHYQVRMTGVASHAGNDPEKGASAIAELARFILFAEALADPEVGTTLCVGTVQGGTAVNVVPERAVAELDCRVWTSDEADRIDSALRGYPCHDTRVRFELERGAARPPLEFGDENERLYREVRRLAQSIGRTLGGARVGGGSDGSFTSSVGCPTVDGLGACGEGPHTTSEHIRVADCLDRVRLLTLLLTDQG